VILDYRASIRIASEDPSFRALIMAAMRKADTSNTEKLKNAFPEIWAELRARYDAPGGFLPGEYHASDSTGSHEEHDDEVERPAHLG